MLKLDVQLDGAVGDDLQKIFEVGESHGVSSRLREIWMTGKRQTIEQFQQDWVRNGKQYIEYDVACCCLHSYWDIKVYVCYMHVYLQLLGNAAISGAWLQSGWVSFFIIVCVLVTICFCF